MRILALLAAVSCIAVTARADADDDAMKEKLVGCLKATGWKKEDLSSKCASDPPTEEAELATHKAWVACVLEGVGVVQESDSGVTINVDKSAKLVPPEKVPKITGIMTKCASRAQGASTGADAAMEIYTCFREEDKDEYTAECVAFVATLL